VLTAIGNDYGYEHVFERQVEALGLEGDVLLAISTSGNSKNCVKALKLAKKLGIKVEKIEQRVHELHEFNPMLGFRGCRLGIKFPEITRMQARAVFEAAADAQKEGLKPKPEIMIPLVGFKKELDLQVGIVHETAKQVQAEKKVKFAYSVGTMIEIPRGALTADEIAQTAEFFSFGTNDLTQMTFGFSRDDVEGRMMSAYLELGLLERNPFEVVDADGVGELIRLAVARGRAQRPGLKIGVCGEHGGDPTSIGTFYDAGLDYVSCSPFRVPVARLAAAQAVLAAGDYTEPPKATHAEKAEPAPKATGSKAKAKPGASSTSANGSRDGAARPQRTARTAR